VRTCALTKVAFSILARVAKRRLMIALATVRGRVLRRSAAVSGRAEKGVTVRTATVVIDASGSG
jgi:hypothetical protein